MRKAYISFDNKVFDSYEACVRYEEEHFLGAMDLNEKVVFFDADLERIEVQKSTLFFDMDRAKYAYIANEEGAKALKEYCGAYDIYCPNSDICSDYQCGWFGQTDTGKWLPQEEFIEHEVELFREDLETDFEYVEKERVTQIEG